jgi:mannose-6-phosphate isomerase
MLYPLKFRPRFFEKMWGGRKMEALLGKGLPPARPVGESWELYDFPPGVVEGTSGWLSSEVANGPLAGRTLHELMESHRRGLLGDVRPVGAHGQFPVLIKFLDARDDLSVQVHPDERYAAAHPDAHLKTEAWYVVQADPGSRLFKGLSPGVTREQFEQAIRNGTVERCIETLKPEPGDCVFMPSGTVHALGAGILAWEVQTPSDTTFRVYDFNRIEASTGQPRKLHVEQALACIDFSGKPEPKQPRSTVSGAYSTVSRFVTSPYFKLERVRMRAGVDQPLPYDQPVVWTVLEGEAELRADGMPEALTVTRGETVVLPARMKNAAVRTPTDCAWLEVTFPANPGATAQ